MALRPQTRVTSNRLPSLVLKLKRNGARQLDALAREASIDASRDIKMRDWSHVSNPMAKRKFMSQRQTGASANSIYWFTSGGDSNYEDVRNTFRQLAGESYGGRTLDQITFDEHKPESSPSRMVSGFASLSLILAFWEYGHHNVFTGRFESAPIISYTAFIYSRKYLSYFTNIMAK